MRIEPEISGVSVVVLGTFNPAIFTPAWFELHGLLPHGVDARAELTVAHPQVTAFTVDWLRLDVVVELLCRRCDGGALCSALRSRRADLQGVFASHSPPGIRHQPRCSFSRAEYC